MRWQLCAGNGCAEVAYRAQQLLEHSLLSELRAIVARALSGLDMFAGGQLSELDLLGSDFLEAPLPAEVRQSMHYNYHFHYCTLFLPRGKVRLRISCSFGGHTPCPFARSKQDLNQTWAYV